MVPVIGGTGVLHFSDTTYSFQHTSSWSSSRQEDLEFPSTCISGRHSRLYIYIFQGMLYLSVESECRILRVFAIRWSSQGVESDLLVSIDIFYESLYNSRIICIIQSCFLQGSTHLVKCSPTLDGYSQEQQRSFRVRKSRVRTHVRYVPPG